VRNTARRAAAKESEVAWTDATLAALPKYIEQAYKGDAIDKRRLLEIFCACVDGNRPVYPELLRYLSKQFAAALDGKELAKELGKHLAGSKEKNRPQDPDNEYRDIELAIAVDRRRGDERDGRPIGVTKALNEIATERNLSRDTVRKAWEKYRAHDLVTNEAPCPQEVRKN